MGNLSELQISLIAIGMVVVMGVVFFNWMQQRRYRRGAEEAFGREHEDVLLRTAVSVEENGRIEPQLGSELLHESLMEPDAEPPRVQELAEPKEEPAASPAISDTPITPVEQAPPPPVNRSSTSGDSMAEAVDYTVGIESGTLIADSNLAALLQRKFDFGKPVRWMGRRSPEAFWEEITIETNNKSGYRNLRGRLQLADRAGPVSEVSLSEFRDMTENFSARVKATANCPDIQKAYERALLLDEFCTRVDVMVGINIISKDTSAFTGAKIRVLAEASGFKLGAEGVFHYRDENNAILFSLGNYEPSPFLPNSMRMLITHGITFLLDVPRVVNGEIVFGQMVHLAEVFTDELDGIMVDDNRLPLSDSGIRKIRQQLGAIQSLMLAHNISPGGETALRLFA
ncbi:cell division protein ZipA C-terminal FtsZ-binding domain-containing protein [Nitrosovibrio sp. Nv4]|uniref:cell division protein ZipA C-terminal FtsZ-binding domain-containing protein n=1 Tax=Nitrosovibrio sp. Nv4 TaxID=1945880 RepID=UPI000BD86F48|nr:cell division protein ZipA C-terminal FtsZ-binding domain-containing protein [Nitrosovibrio sp. Nv4]SOD40841.1 ZipA, C-terminal FtsZ-binding domain [Nitrosovibrio sp. Nv4]